MSSSLTLKKKKKVSKGGRDATSLAAAVSLLPDQQLASSRQGKKKKEKAGRSFPRGQVGEFLSGADADDVSDSGHQHGPSETERSTTPSKEFQ